jgi:tetratricopeptide (TPR) repeat protein
MPKARAAAQRAIELDPALAEPHAALGMYYAGYAFNDAAAEREIRRAIELNPNYATAWHWLVATLVHLNRFDEAFAASKRAMELDPLSVIISADQAYNLVVSHRYDDAIAQVQQTFKLDPNFYYAHYILGWAYLQKGTYPEAVASFRKSLELNEDPFAKALLVRALAKSGQRAEALKLRDELKAETARRYLPTYFLAIASYSLEEMDETFALLNKDIDERSTYANWLKVDPTFDDLRSDARYAALLRKIDSMKLD